MWISLLFKSTGTSMMVVGSTVVESGTGMPYLDTITLEWPVCSITCLACSLANNSVGKEPNKNTTDFMVSSASTGIAYAITFHTACIGGDSIIIRCNELVGVGAGII